MKYRVWLAAALGTMIVAGLRPAPAADRDLEKFESRLAQVEQQLRDLQAAFRQQGADIAQKMAAVDQMRGDWNGFQGQVDAMSQKQEILLEQFRKYIDEFEGRLRRVESARGAANETNPAGEESESTAAVAGAASTNPYQEGLNAVQERNYDGAIAHFRRALQADPKGSLAAGAQYWIAECLYAQRKFQPAIEEYRTLIDRYPQSDKLAAAWLKQGMAFAELGQKTAAGNAYRQVAAKAPSSKEAKRAATQLRLLESSTATAERVK